MESAQEIINIINMEKSRRSAAALYGLSEQELDDHLATERVRFRPEEGSGEGQARDMSPASYGQAATGRLPEAATETQPGETSEA